MNRQEIEKNVADILVDKLGVEHDDVKNDAKFDADLGGDSLDCVEVIIELEHTFDIFIRDEEAAECKTVKDICDLVESHLR